MNISQLEFDILILISNSSNTEEISQKLNISQEDVRDCLTKLYARILAIKCRSNQSTLLENLDSPLY